MTDNDDPDLKEGVNTALYELVKSGDITVSTNPDGSTVYTLTEKGRARLAESGHDLEGRD